MDKLLAGKYSFEVSSPDKIFFPDDKITKGDIIKYYKKISSKIIPYLKERPLTMLRYPDGINGEHFFQKDAPGYFPGWIKTKKLKRKEGGSVEYLICSNSSSLLYTVNQGSLTPHIWLSKIDKPDKPDKLIFDLDPPGDDFEPVKYAAKKLNEFLSNELKLKSFLMTTGSRGVHVVIPLKRDKGFDEVRAFAQKVANILSGRYPEKITDKIRKDKRKGKLFVDTARNGYAQTSVAPYAVRAKKHAPIAVPIDWDELNNNDMKGNRYDIKNIFRRLGNKKDPWEGMFRHATNLENAGKILSNLIS